jgi:hypothetical protein
MFENVFIAVYTHQCKSYCDYEFFNNLFASDIGSASVAIIDNSPDTTYFHYLYDTYSDRAYIDHVAVDRAAIENAQVLFLRNVEASLYGLRRMFLDGDYEYFIILESDVRPRDAKWLHYFMEVVGQADIIGGLYYDGPIIPLHVPEMWQGPPRIIPTHHALSGCTLYKRAVLERFAFRTSAENLGAFPDAWMSVDAGGAGFKIANYTKIQCDHMTDEIGLRGQQNIN